jgi:hypothetical protein
MTVKHLGDNAGLVGSAAETARHRSLIDEPAGNHVSECGGPRGLDFAAIIPAKMAKKSDRP